MIAYACANCVFWSYNLTDHRVRRAQISPWSRTAYRGLDCRGRNVASTLSRISSKWEGRAQVRAHALAEDDAFDPTLPDYLEELLPFHDHPRFQEATEEQKQTILTCGWLGYNAKTIDIESNVIIPACLEVIEGRVPGADAGHIRHASAQTLTDESYHVLLTQHGSDVTMRMRGLEGLQIPSCSVISHMQRLVAEAESDAQRRMILMVTSIVTEVFISGYLRRLASATSIQPVSIETTKIHLIDELTHCCIFKMFAKSMVEQMTQRELRSFARLFPTVLQWFADSELEVWSGLFDQIGFSYGREIIEDCRRRTQDNQVDDSELRKLFGELDLPYPSYPM